MKKKTIIVVVALLAIGYLSVRSFAAWSKGFYWKEMDWNQDGQTSLSEFIASSDVGLRDVQKDGKTCREFFSFKDGMPVKVICPSEQMQAK